MIFSDFTAALAAGRRSRMSDKYSYFSHRECEFFPCHPGADPDDFNCLFCYCPLYMLGERCEGSFSYLDNGIKDCSACLYPHLRENYGAVNARFHEIAEAMRKNDKDK